METLKIKSALILLLLVLSSGCSKYFNDDNSSEKNKKFAVHQLETEYNLIEFEPQDQLKIAVSEALSNLLINDREYAKDFISNLVDKDGKIKEVLYIEESKLLEQLLIDNITVNNSSKNNQKTSERQIREGLIRNAETILPNLVIKIPDWVNSIIEEIGLEELDFAVYAGINTKNPLFQIKRPGDTIPYIRPHTLVDYIPIQIKESEKLIPLKRGTNTTIWDDNLIDDHFPSLRDCTEFNREEYIVSRNDEYDFLDRIRLNEDLVNAKLCSIDISGGNDISAPCNTVYQRDCVTEKNIIKGIGLGNNAVFLEINNQPEGEDVISLHYVFLASQMCGDTSVSRDCPPISWKLIFYGKMTDFYDIQYHSGSPTSSELSDVIYIGRQYYVKYFSKLYDIPLDNSLEQVYSQTVYLQGSPNGTWDGNVYGSVVNFSVYEHDDVTVELTQPKSITISNYTQISTKLSTGEDFKTGADFSTINRSSSYTYTIEPAIKDIELGDNTSVYFDQNFQNSAIGYGINRSTGSVNTHFAFYYTVVR